MKRNTAELDGYLNKLSDAELRRIVTIGVQSERGFAAMFGVKLPKNEVYWDLTAYGTEAFRTLGTLVGDLPIDLPASAELEYGALQGVNMTHFAQRIASGEISMKSIQQLKDVYVRFLIKGQTVHLPFARCVEACFSDLTRDTIQRQ